MSAEHSDGVSHCTGTMSMQLKIDDDLSSTANGPDNGSGRLAHRPARSLASYRRRVNYPVSFCQAGSQEVPGSEPHH